MFVYKLKFILLPQLIATLNNYACLLPPLVMSTGLLYHSAFHWPCKSMTGEMAPKGSSNLAVGDLIWLPPSVYICLGFVVEYWSFVDACTHHGYSKLYYLCHLASLFKLLPPPTTTPTPLPPTHSLIYAGPTLMKSMKTFIKNWQNQPLSTCQVSCTTANR